MVVPPVDRRTLLGFTGLLIASQTSALAAAADGADQPRSADTLLLDAPAADWVEAFPIGNGRLGAMVHGGVTREMLSLNEDTLWSGQPVAPPDTQAATLLPRMRDLVFAGDYHAADRLAKAMQGPFSQAYQPLADLAIDMHHAGEPTGYRRMLDLDTAAASVTYQVDGVGFAREAFASFPDNIVVLRLTADRAGALACRVALSSLLRSTARASGRRLVLTGKAPTYSSPNYHKVPEPIVYSDVPGRGMAFTTLVDVRTDGTVTTDGDGLRIAGAGTIELRIAAATGFRGFDLPPDLPAEAIEAKAAAALDRARGTPYAQLRKAHVADHRALYRRTRLDLGPARSDTATDRRRANDLAAPDPSLAALLFHFGRYLLIASSRPGSQPANLQGIWNHSVRPPWSCNFTTNINVEMNYWPAETCNLAECHLPLIDWIEGLAKTGAVTARAYYGMPGWCLHHNSDVWAMTNPAGDGGGGPSWANWAMGAPWLAQHLWERYAFGSGDRAYLRDRAWPLMKGAAEFCAAWLVRDPTDGRLTTAPSTSPENLFIAPDGKTAAVSDGATLDFALIRELFANCIAAAGVLGTDTAFAERLAALLPRLEPYRIGRYGQLQEWQHDFAEQDPGHRHISHLYPLYPGAEFSAQRTPGWAEAVRRSMQRREDHGGAATGWSRAWAIAIWARLGDGTRAGQSVTTFVTNSTFSNMLDKYSSVFQIDGNFGITAAIAEMLLQSHDGEIAILPALPPGWTKGKVQGLRARGGTVVDIDWTTDRVIARLRGGSGPLRVRPPRGYGVKGRATAATGAVTLTAGADVRLTMPRAPAAGSAS